MKPWPVSEYIKRELPRPPWAIENLLPAFGITLLYAFPKVGKSILAIQLAHALGTQALFLGYNTHQKLKVLYLQSDLPEGEWQTQIGKVGLVEGWDTHWIEDGWLYNPKLVQDVKHTIVEGGYDFVIYDALSTISGYASLDDLVIMGRCLTVLRSVSDKPCMVIHHKRKGVPGVPDHTSVSASGSFVLSAGASTLFDLSDTSLRVRGRYVREEINLARDLATGQWKAKRKEDIYKLP